MRNFEVYDHVALKHDPGFYGTVHRTNTDSYDPLEDELIIAHTDVDPDVLNEFLVTGIPPVGYVFVQFADEATGSSLVSQDDLVLLSRSFQIGDNVKRDGNPMTGAVIDVSEFCILEPISISPSVVQAYPDLLAAPQPCSAACTSSLPAGFSHSNPHSLIYHVPTREVKRAQDVMKDDYIIGGDWVGLVDDVEYDAVVRLGNGSIVVLAGVDGMHLPIPDFNKPLVALPENEDFPRPDIVGAIPGYANTIAPREPRPGLFVIIDRSRLRAGRWIAGSYDPGIPAQGIILDVRAREVFVDWVTNSMSVREATSSMPKVPFTLYDNISTFKSSTSLRQRREVTVYDVGKMPIKSPAQDDDNSVNSAYPGQDLSVGFRVKFRDPTAAAVKYQGESNHGTFTRLAAEAFGGWDLNEFKLVHIQQQVTVLWQDGSTTKIESKELKGFGLFEVELAPSDIVLKREGMQQRPIAGEDGDRTVGNFNEMTFFERPHDLLPQSVGVVQAVDPVERVASVRWYQNPKLQLLGSGQVLARDSRFGAIGDRVEDVSLYEIMTFPSLTRRRRDMCIVAPKRRDAANIAAQHPGHDDQPSQPTAPGSRTTRTGYPNSQVPPPWDSPSKRVDWVGEIVAMGLDGSITLRLGGSQPCRDVSIDPDSILAIIDDRPHFDEMQDQDDSMDMDLWDDEPSDWSGVDSPEPISEIVEYEGGERLDNDSGEDNWVSDEDEEFADAEEEFPDEREDEDEDVQMPDAGIKTEVVTIPTSEPSLVPLQAKLPHEAPPRFLVLECEPPPDQFGLHSAAGSSASLKRIVREHKILASSLPEGEIYVRTYESRLDLLRCLIIGPRDTPYEHAPFVVDLYLSERFPAEPPTAHFHSWTSGLGRINPNLYEEGKICLSLLGTWSGKNESEKWSEQATLLQLLVSLQGLVFVRRPFYNEAGFEGYETDTTYARESDQYSEKAFVMARGFVKYALLRPPGGLEDILAWLYLPHGTGDEAAPCLLSTIVARGRTLMQKSDEARLEHDDSPMDAGGGKDDPTQVFLRPLSRGAAVMLKRVTEELQALLDRRQSRVEEAEAEAEGAATEPGA